MNEGPLTQMKDRMHKPKKQGRQMEKHFSKEDILTPLTCKANSPQHDRSSYVWTLKMTSIIPENVGEIPLLHYGEKQRLSNIDGSTTGRRKGMNKWLVMVM